MVVLVATVAADPVQNFLKYKHRLLLTQHLPGRPYLIPVAILSVLQIFILIPESTDRPEFLLEINAR